MKALVTGANRGIGLEFCRQLKAQGTDVLAVCRNPSAELQDLGVTCLTDIDVTQESSLSKLADQIEDQSLDLLINNAGIMRRSSLDNFDLEGIREQFEVNALGPLRCTQKLLRKLGKNAKVAMITSRMGSIADNTSGGSYGYRMSKAALNMGSVSLARDLQAKGTTVVILHPGYVKTDMTNHSGHITPEESVTGLLKVIDKVGSDQSGTFWHTNGEPLPW